MYEVPSFGRAYFDGEMPGKSVVVGIGAAGVRLLDASDGDRPILAEYSFDIIASFVCSDGVRQTAKQDDGYDTVNEQGVPQQCVF